MDRARDAHTRNGSKDASSRAFVRYALYIKSNTEFYLPVLSGFKPNKPNKPVPTLEVAISILIRTWHYETCGVHLYGLVGEGER